MKVFLVSILALVIAVGGGCGGSDNTPIRRRACCPGSEAEALPST